VTSSLISSVKKRITENNPGWCFSYTDFADIENYDAIRQTLSRLHKIGFIRRLTKGVYYFPRYHDKLGELPPTINAIIDAMQRAYSIKCQPSGAYAANLLGLSEQVPARIVILTDGPSKTIKIDNKVITFKKTVPRNMATAGTITGLIIQAIKFLGKENITDQQISHLKNRLSDDDINELKQKAYLAPAWIAKLIKSELVGG